MFGLLSVKRGSRGDGEMGRRGDGEQVEQSFLFQVKIEVKKVEQ